MFTKIGAIAQKAVTATKFLALISETAQFFYEKGVEKGLFAAKD